MASALLHIKDAYYFEVPKFLWPSNRRTLQDFEPFWVALDDEYLQWEAARFVKIAEKNAVPLPDSGGLLKDYANWQHHDHAHAGKPFVSFLEQTEWFREASQDRPMLKDELAEVQQQARDVAAFQIEASWSEAKIFGYNKALSGKILIPQPFGQIRNLHESASGFCISKFMIVQVLVALIVAFVFIRLANRMRSGSAPKGRLWNLLESVLLFIRDQIARPAIGKKDGDKYVPLLWTIFLFILGMNLMGMVPWVGAPTSAWGVTLAMAVVTLATGIYMGSIKFGPVGFWLNQVPSMDLPIYMAVILKPLVWAIEVVGMLIKHTILSVRLLANMVAGHLVLLGVMALAFSFEGASSESWWIAAPIALIGSTLFSLLELFVAFLQAYIFTFLSALFIGAATHHH